MNKISSVLIGFLLVAVFVLGWAVISLYQRDDSSAGSSAGEPSDSLSSAAESERGDGEQAAGGAGDAASSREATGSELRCTVQMGSLQIIQGEEFGIQEGDTDNCEAYWEDGVYTVSASTTKNDPIVVTVPEGICFAQASFTTSGGTLTVRDLDVQDLKVTCERGAIQFSGRVEGDAEVEHRQGETALRLEGEASEFNYEVSYELGHVQIGEQSYAGAKGSQSIDNRSEQMIRIHCAMGSVDVLFPEGMNREAEGSGEQSSIG